MKTIRRNVFETNSSSTHSVSVSNKYSNYCEDYCLNPFIDYDDKVHVRFGEFGWEIDSYNTPYEKLQYIITMLAETEGRSVLTTGDFFETKGFKLINEAVADYCHCDGIWIDSNMKMSCYEWDNKTYCYLDHDGYIDHQSCEDYDSVQDFLDDYGVDINQFLFDNGVVVHTDNDNHY